MRDRWNKLLGLLECESTGQLQTRSSALIEDLGFAHWVYTLATPTSAPSLRLGTLPDEWLVHYQRRRYARIDPVLDHCRQHATPCLWASDPQARRAGYLTEYFPEAADFGLSVGIGMPLHGPIAQARLLSVAACSAEQARRHLARLGELQLIASFMQEADQGFLHKRPMPCATAQLSQREQDCLRWAAEGKTSWEIGQLLDIAERTAIFHLNNAARKLGVTGRRQAIARALSLQLISL